MHSFSKLSDMSILFFQDPSLAKGWMCHLISGHIRHTLPEEASRWLWFCPSLYMYLWTDVYLSSHTNVVQDPASREIWVRKHHHIRESVLHGCTKNETTNGKTSVYISRIKKITSNIYSKLKRPLMFQLHANTHPSFGLPGIWN